MTKEEVLSLIDLLERVRLPAERQFGLSEPDPVWNMTVYLMKRHLTGMLVTTTSLARAADVPYTTALRRIDKMHRQGLLLYRPRTKSGRSFSIHPSGELIERMFSYAFEVKSAIEASTGSAGSGPNALRAVRYDMEWTFPIQPAPTRPMRTCRMSCPPILLSAVASRPGRTLANRVFGTQSHV